MSPRSAEFLAAARRRLETARNARTADPTSALSLAYYAMLYAARGALSERDSYAKTHSGTWDRFHREFVDPSTFGAELASAARKVQPEREDADFDAWLVPTEEAERVIELADRFISAVEAMLAK